MTVEIKGYGYCIRPIETHDAIRILQLRTDPHLGRYLNPTVESVKAQQQWIEEQHKRQGDHYFAVQRDCGRWEGAIGLYAIDNGEGEWGRWILSRGSLAAAASVLLLLEFGFERLGLERAYCRTLLKNSPVVRFHDSCAYSARREITDQAGRCFVEHAILRRDWPVFRHRLGPIADRVAERVIRS